MTRAKRKTQVEECWSLTLPELYALRLSDGPADSEAPIDLHALHREAGFSTCTLGVGCTLTADAVLIAFYTDRGGFRWQRLGIDRTPQRLGGTRLWIVCGCGKRTSKIRLPYVAEDRPDAAFACRTCHRLTYRSAQEAHREERVERTFARRLAASRTAMTFAALAFDRLPDATGDLAEALATALERRADGWHPRMTRRSEGRDLAETR